MRPYDGVGNAWDVLRLPDGYYRAAPGVRTGAVAIERTLVILPPAEAPRPAAPTNVDFDPLSFFFVHDQPAGAYVRHMRELWDKYKDSGENVEVRRDGDVVEFAIWDARGGASAARAGANVARFDLASGGNVCSVDFHDDSGLLTWESQVTYAKVCGAWVPATHSLVLNRKADRSIRQDVRFIRNDENDPPKDADFTVEKMGLGAATWVTDLRSMVTYVYGDKAHTLLRAGRVSGRRRDDAGD